VYVISIFSSTVNNKLRGWKTLFYLSIFIRDFYPLSFNWEFLMQRKILGSFLLQKYHKQAIVKIVRLSVVDSIGNHKLTHKQTYTLPYGLHTSYVKLTVGHLKACLIIGADNIMNLTYVINTTEWRNSGVKCESTIRENKILKEFLHHSMGKAKMKWDSKFP